LTSRAALAYDFSQHMSFWDDLSPSVKRYIVIGAVVLVGLIAMRSCFGPEADGEPPPRGAQH
jgi:hypothetical protein